MDTVNSDYVYWTFSAAAQSISAFVALLLTGYALVHNLMEAVREKDDTLEEIHSALRKTYHTWLTGLAIVTGCAITLSLLSVYMNRWDFSFKNLFLIVTTLFDVIAIAGGLWFVVSIVNPRKYEKAAGKVLENKSPELKLSGESTSAAEFFEQFRHLEQLIREYLRQKDLYIPSKGAPRMSFSFRQMVEALLQNEVIDSQFFEELLEINKYRNLVFHGHFEKADKTMIKRVSAAEKKINKITSDGQQDVAADSPVYRH
jgi:hypothetical protein